MKRGENASQAAKELVRQRGTEYMRQIGRRGGITSGKKNARRKGYMKRLSRLGVAAVSPEERKERGRRFGQKNKGRVLTPEHRAKIAETKRLKKRKPDKP